MALNYGKAFESKFKEDFLKVQDATIDRLYDPTGGYACIKNICDFIGYIYPNIFYIECKSIKGSTFPLAKLTQYDKLISKAGITGVRVGVVIWFYEKNLVLYVPITTVAKLKNDEKKSINVKYLNTKEYNIIEVPSKLKRIFMDSDYSILKNLKDGE